MNRPFRACFGPIRSAFGGKRQLLILAAAIGGVIGTALPLGALPPAAGAPSIPAPSGAVPLPASATSPKPTLPIQTNTAPTQTEKDLVLRFITERVALLGKDAAAREDLIAASTTGSPKDPAAPAYLGYYTNKLNEQLLPLVTSPDMRVRINAAIVVAKVSANAQNPWLGPCVEKLLAKDQKEAAAIWGIKAAGAILPLPGAHQKDLLQLMVNMVTAHARFGALADEAYTALAPTTIAPSKDIIDKLQDIYEARINQYKTVIPDDPAAERRTATFLTDRGGQGMWTISDKPRQTRTMQLIANFLKWGGIQLEGAGPEEKDQLLASLLSTLKAVQVVAGSDTPLGGAAKSATGQLPTAAKPSDVIQPVVDLIVSTFGVTAPQ